MTSAVPRIFICALFSGLMAGLLPPCALGDDAARISRLESEIQLLRTRIDEQHRRILRLEDALKARTPDPMIGATPRRYPDKATIAGTDSLPWHTPESWERVTEGMSESQVTAFLGQPTAIESVGVLKTLFYRGAAAASDPESGHVNLRDDRVVAVSKPVFGD